MRLSSSIQERRGGQSAPAGAGQTAIADRLAPQPERFARITERAALAAVEAFFGELEGLSERPTRPRSSGTRA